MKFMMLMYPGVYNGPKKVKDDFQPTLEKIEPMGKFNDAMGQELEILDLAGLKPQASGARVTFEKGKPTVTPGSDIESKETLGGYWLLEAPSMDAVVKWAKRCPVEPGDMIEIRQIWDLEELS